MSGWTLSHLTLQALSNAAGHSATLLADHLWQSTLFATAVGVLTLAFRKNQARVRFVLWMAASLKFLIPFALLVSLGNYLAPRHPATASSRAFYVVVEQVSQPFARTPAHGSGSFYGGALLALAAVWLCGSVAVLVFWGVRWRRVAAAVRMAEPVGTGREVEALDQLEGVIGVRGTTRLIASTNAMEPGIFGLFRPVLLWPVGLSDHLDDEQLRAILAHELWHVRRRDNLAAALHMLVEAAFWFHPLVWWIGARMVEERERACDEEVLRLGNRAEVYAESILKACRFCVETPLACVSGVAGANPSRSQLKERIVRIMNLSTAEKLTVGRRLLLASAATVVVAGPLVFGVMKAPQLHAQPLPAGQTLAPGSAASFDSATIVPSNSADKRTEIQMGPGTAHYGNATVKDLIKFAYGVEAYQVLNAPDWADSERYNVDASWKPAQAKQTASIGSMPPAPLVPDMHSGQLQIMLRTLLAERFSLKFNEASNVLPVYDLVVASGGSKLTPTPTEPAPPSFNGEPIIRMDTLFKAGNGEISMQNGPAAALAGFLSQQLDRQVLDKTGLTGNFDITFHWQQGESQTESISAGLEEQLGLRLDARQAPVRTLSIQQLEKPAEN
jgi:bla regulator protein BlaR1